MNRQVIDRILTFVMRNIKKVLILVAGIILIGSVAYLCYDLAYEFFANDPYLEYDENGEKVTLNIEKGATNMEIATLLEENGLIESAVAFRWKAQLSGDAAKFQYGTYTFIKGMNYIDIVEVLSTGSKAEGVKITIVEGWTIEQIGDYLQQNNICMKDDFIEACNRTEYNFDYYGYITNADQRRNLLEGYLFPDTYEIIPQNGAEAIVARLLRQTELNFEKNGRLERMDELGLTIDQVITMASVVERESRIDEERAKVSRVLYNRLAQGMRWQVDATVLYAQGRENDGVQQVLFEDLEFDSPYNTYKVDGYPVGAICNPGQESIDAVLYPENGKWLYYVLTNAETGEHLFTDNYDEFLENAYGNQ